MLWCKTKPIDNYCPCGSDGLYCFRWSFFHCTQDNSSTAALSSMKFCKYMYLDNHSKPREFQASRSKIKVTAPDFRIRDHCEIGRKSLWTHWLMNRCTQPDDILHQHVPWQPQKPYWISRSKVNVIFVSEPKFTKLFSLNMEKSWLITQFSACRLLDPLQRYSRSKSSCLKFRALSITHEQLHLPWWNFVCTCTLTTCRTLLNFKVIGQRSTSHGFLGVFLCASVATCGEYLALSMAWWSYFCLVFMLQYYRHSAVLLGSDNNSNSTVCTIL